MSSATTQLPVLIIGGGPSGLTAALTLSQNGIPVRVIDKAAEFHHASRGSGIHPRTSEVFRFLEVLDDIRRLGRELPRSRSYKMPGGTEVERVWDLLEKTPRTPDRPYHVMQITQWLNEGVFREHLAKFGVQVELGMEPTALEQDADGVTVTVKKTGHDGAETIETIKAPYVIGADGARGFSRRAIGAIFEGQTKEEDGHVWADVDVEGVTPDYWHVWPVLNKCTITMRPRNDTGAFHVGIIGQNFDPIDLLEQNKFVDFIREQTGRKELVFKNFTSFTYWKPKMRMVNKFFEGRAFIAGDAAHVHSPTGGQGLNTSVQDTFNLGWKMALVYKGLAPRELLSTYQAERLPVITQMLLVTSGLYTHAVPKKAEEVKVGSENTSGFLQWRNPALPQLDLNYRWSPIVYDARGTNGLSEDDLKARAYAGYPGEDVRAGDRAPNAPGLVKATGEEVELFDIFRPYRHTTLVFGSGTEAKILVDSVASAVKMLPTGLVKTIVIGRDAAPNENLDAEVYHDKQEYAYRFYHVEGEKARIVVVRPDGYVGAFVDDVDGFRVYLSKVFSNV